MIPSKLTHTLPRVLCLTLVASGAIAAVAASPDEATLKRISALAVPFVPNAGQWDSRAAFKAQAFAGTLFVTKQGELVYSLPGKPVATDADGVDGGSGPSPVARERVGVRAMEKQNSLSQQRPPGWTLTETLVDASGKPRSMASAVGVVTFARSGNPERLKSAFHY